MAESLALLVRGVHVLAAGGLLGGAALVALVAWRGRTGGVEAAALRPAARAYEALAWAALGVLVATGVGNLGAYGAGLPGPGTPWGDLLLLKLAGVLALLAGSAARTAVVALFPGPGDAAGPGEARLLAAAVLGAGVTLGHGAGS